MSSEQDTLESALQELESFSVTIDEAVFNRTISDFTQKVRLRLKNLEESPQNEYKPIKGRSFPDNDDPKNTQGGLEDFFISIPIANITEQYVGAYPQYRKSEAEKLGASNPLDVHQRKELAEILLRVITSMSRAGILYHDPDTIARLQAYPDEPPSQNLPLSR